MSGRGLSPVAGEYFDRFPVHFRALWHRPEFLDVCNRLESGFAGEAEANVFRDSCQSLRHVCSGMLGDYHYKMFWDFLVATRWFPARLVRRYPVCQKGGTAIGLARVFALSKQVGAKKCSVLLDVLTGIVQARAKSWQPGVDHAGIVGAQLCWLKRLETPAS
eukprot:12425371-Karenia_brevis.AAC.1